MATTKFSRGTAGFMQWVQMHNPQLYARIKSKTGVHNLSGLGLDTPDATQDYLTSLGVGTSSSPSSAVAQQPMGSGLADSIKNIATTFAQVYLTKNQLDAQNQMIKTNLTRAQQGLPPINYDMSTFAPRANIGLSSDTKTFFIWGGAAVLGFFVLKHMMPRR